MYSTKFSLSPKMEVLRRKSVFLSVACILVMSSQYVKAKEILEATSQNEISFEYDASSIAEPNPLTHRRNTNKTTQPVEGAKSSQNSISSDYTSLKQLKRDRLRLLLSSFVENNPRSSRSVKSINKSKLFNRENLLRTTHNLDSSKGNANSIKSEENRSKYNAELKTRNDQKIFNAVPKLRKASNWQRSVEKTTESREGTELSENPKIFQSLGFTHEQKNNGGPEEINHAVTARSIVVDPTLLQMRYPTLQARRQDQNYQQPQAPVQNLQPLESVAFRTQSNFNSIDSLYHGMSGVSSRYYPEMFRVEKLSELANQKQQRSSQFIPICPPAYNITEIYQELCADEECDDEFFRELSKKKWTEEVLRVAGMTPSNFPLKSSSFEEHRMLKPVPLLNHPEIKPVQTPPKPPAARSENLPGPCFMKVYAAPKEENYAESSKTISQNEPTAQNNFSNDVYGWNQNSVPHKVFSSGDLTNLKNVVLTPIFRKTENPNQSSCPKPSLREQNLNGVIYPGHNYPALPGSCPDQNRFNVLDPAPPSRNEIESCKNTMNWESDPAVEKIPELKQIITTRMIPHHALHKHSHGEERSERDSRLEEVHIITFNCTGRNTPTNEKNMEITLRDVKNGELWPHSWFLKLIPLSESFYEDLNANSRSSEQLAEMFKPDQNSTNKT